MKSKETLRNHEKTCKGLRKTREELQLDNTGLQTQMSMQATNKWQLLAMLLFWLSNQCMTS